MNYCATYSATTERCDCYSYKDNFHDPVVHDICEIGQVCTETGHAQASQFYECLDVCMAGRPSPCFNITQNGQFGAIASNQVGLLLYPGDINLTILPIAVFDTFLTAQSACLVNAGESPEWAVCESGQYCGKLSETTAKCTSLCPSKSIVVEKCLCRAQDGSTTLAQPGQFCGDDGSVSEFTDSTCKLNSFGNGICRCVAGQNACPATSVCVNNSGTVQCMPACKLNADNKSETECACRGPKSTEIVPSNGRCVIQNDGTAAPQTLQVCANQRIGPCACRVTSQLNPAQYAYTDASNTCMFSQSRSVLRVTPLLAVGSLATDRQPCQNTANNPTQANLCLEGEYCMQTIFDRVECLDLCQKDFVTDRDCACASPDGKTAKLAASGDFCSANGEVVERQFESCHPSANVVSSCKCLKNDRNECQNNQYCSAQNGTQTCVPMCLAGSNWLLSNCVCPYSGSDALVPENSICACQWASQLRACAAVSVCQPGQIGPCGVFQENSQSLYVNSKSAFVQILTNATILRLCKPNVITNQWCACESVETTGETPTKATAIESGNACMRRPDGTTVATPECQVNFISTAECACRIAATAGGANYSKINSACMNKPGSTNDVVQECALGDVSGTACACRISGEATGASYCAVGSVCMVNPDDNDKQICWRPCSNANPCPNDKKCIETGDTAHCEFTCPANCTACTDAPEFCTECDAGYYLSGGEVFKTCAKCPIGCVSCTSQTSCQDCATGLAGKQCNICANGYKQTSTRPAPLVCEKIDCSAAAPNCTICESTTKCKVCNIGFAGSDCKTCATGYTGNGCADCVEGYAKAPGSEACTKIVCDPNCDICATTTSCKACKPDFITTGASDAQTCVLDCPNLIPKCAECSSKTECTKCDIGFTEKLCDTCTTGYTGNNCDTCADGYKKVSGFNVCDKILCGDNCKVCATATSCKTCDTDYTTTGAPDAQTCVLDCPTLIPNCAECSSSTECDKCKTGYSGSKCNTCDTGYTGDKCDTCVEGYEKAFGSNVCTKIECDTNCNVCLAADNCKTCKPTYTTTGATDKKTCMPDCLKTVKGCAVCKSATACEVCSEAAVKPDSKGACAKGLSAGAIAGITIAVVVAAGGIAAGAYFAVRALKAKKTIAGSQNTVQFFDQQPVLATESGVQ